MEGKKKGEGRKEESRKGKKIISNVLSRPDILLLSCKIVPNL